jgi:hypothetical protein
MTNASTLKLGGRVLRAGDIVKVRKSHGTGHERGRYKITGFDESAGTVDCYGGPVGLAPKLRCFYVDRISTRVALAGSDKANDIAREIGAASEAAPARPKGR